jgi:prepilin-type N-terminal cleavage/methylation domain-containing protein
MKHLKKKSAFTLIELIVVVIIVAILASLAVPLMAGQTARARASELEAGLGTIRTALRAIQAEDGTFPIIAAGSPVVGNVLGINAGDLTGRWAEDNDYTVVSTNAPAPGTYCVSVTADTGGLEGVALDSDVNNNDDANGLARSIDETGQIFTAAGC